MFVWSCLQRFGNRKKIISCFSFWGGVGWGGNMYELFFCHQTAPFDLQVCACIGHTYICHVKERSTFIEMASVSVGLVLNALKTRIHHCIRL